MTTTPFRRSSGVLLHLTSLPGRYGSGDMGEEAYRFVDFLAKARQRLWQVLPLGPTGYGNAPYSAASAFAGNPWLLSLDRLVADGLLDAADVANPPAFPVQTVDFGWMMDYRNRLLRKAYERFPARREGALAEDYHKFLAENRHWLDDFALFMALKQRHDQRCWRDWPDEDKFCSPVRRDVLLAECRAELDYHRFIQFEFQRQWAALRAYANSKQISIVGDIPIFVGDDSADVWANKQLFQFDAESRPLFVAGCPPDGFAPTGQLWGNPHYRWFDNREAVLSWWLDRFAKQFELYDIVRIDHFRGFEAYWEIPGGDPTAEHGRWVQPNGHELFERLQARFGPQPIIAEDLGTITEEVTALRRAFGFPGMKIFQFGIESCNPADAFLPENYEEDSVAYTGTHDNDTTLGWYRASAQSVREFVCRYSQATDEVSIVRDLVRRIWESRAVIAIVPMQDVLAQASDCRMNFPGRAEHQWQYRYDASHLVDWHADWLAQMTAECQRLG